MYYSLIFYLQCLFLKKIGKNACFNGAEIDNLGKLKEIKGDVNFKNTKIADLGNLEKIGGRAVFQDSEVINLGKLIVIGFSDENVISSTYKLNFNFFCSAIENILSNVDLINSAFRIVRSLYILVLLRRI